MSYSNLPSGGASVSSQGKTLCVGYVIGGPGFEAVALLEAIAPGQWEARWNSGFDLEDNNKAAIATAGGEVNWLKTFIPAINAAIKQIFGTAPTPVPMTTQGKVNAALASSFTLVANSSGLPVFAAK